MTINLLTTAGFTALCLILLAAVWYWHGQAEAQRKRAEEADAWSQWFQEAAEEQATQLRAINAELSALRRQHGRLEAMYTDLVRNRLADNYAIVHRNIIGRSRMS